ncbi:efflux RND transporter periplasmic adaptor subunit [Salinimonas sediminis]|uniref:Efflux RND transporter periplasmic adaptor subunit n=1 Tax=Salinimonas sediminis TaxID=2303538 RepID=A0A346NKB8_9ALTE|nr:efflux RND transporter periplasmic adaptor subunit [Salinimonas sediminis]AXR05975.1 efflux RND transporter periplasmic adaptor subunit [Salinimonas sediminis]
MKWIKFVAPLAVIVVGGLGTYAVVATASDETVKEALDTRPVVTVETLSPVDYTVQITSYGEVTPLERTRLAAQVDGEVMSWNPAFVTGGLVKRGDILFTIEKDTYEAALLQAEAALASAQAQLIQEQAQGRVAEQEAKSLTSGNISDLYLRKPQMLSAQAAVKSAEAMLKIARRDLANCEVTAPYDALIATKEVGVGDYVTVGTLTATLNNVETAEIMFPVAGFDRAFLPADLAQHPAVVSTAGPMATEFTAVINRDAGLIDTATRMTHLILRIDDPYGIRSGEAKVKFGTYVNVTFSGKTLDKVYRVAQELITNNQLWLLDDEGKLYAKQVTVLREEAGDFFITGDFDGARIVMTPPEYPQEGMPVKVLKSDQDLVAHRPRT